MAKKFIPNGDGDFVMMAESFARGVAHDPAAYDVSPEESLALTATVRRFRDAYQETLSRGRSMVATARKEATRVEAEKLIRRLAHAFRANPKVGVVGRINLGMRERSTSTTAERLPHEAPSLRFARAIHEGGAPPEHVVEFHAKDGKPRPPGATRLELFVDLIPPDEDAQTFYTQASPPRPIYVRSYAKSPIRLIPPMAREAMRVVYFARWADAAGEVGPLSHPAQGWVEGGRHHLMGPALGTSNGGAKRPMAWDDTRARETTVVVALLAAAQLTHARPEVRQLEGPIDAAA